MLTGTHFRPQFVLRKRNLAYVEGRSRRTAQEREARKNTALLAVFLVAGLLPAYLAVESWTRWLRIALDHGVTTGVVTRTDVDARGDEPTYTVEYRFEGPTDRTPRSRVGSQRVSYELFESTKVGAPITVHYAASTPSTSYVEDRLNLRLAVTAFTAAWFTITGFALRRTADGVRTATRLAREGRLLPGELLAATSEDDDGSLVVKVRYRFRAPNGLWVYGDDAHPRSDLKHGRLPGPGTPVAVVFLDYSTYSVL